MLAILGSHRKTRASRALSPVLCQETIHHALLLGKISQTILNDAPKTLIARQVILEVKRLLTNTHDSIEIIADKMHFKDLSYLSRYFKKMTNMTLSQFRQQAGNDKA